MELDLLSQVFWLAVLQIIIIDILLGGDNAIVIALACRKLPEKQRKLGILYGVAGAIILRIILIFFAVQLLAMPWLKITGGLLLLWIGVKLIKPDDSEHNITAETSLFAAIKTIIIADLVMSLDNVIAVAAASHGNMTLVVFGILFSIPIIIFGSQLVLKLMDKYPLVIVAGGALLGWIGGSMIASDVAISTQVNSLIPQAKYIFGITGAVLVVLIGKMLAKNPPTPHST